VTLEALKALRDGPSLQPVLLLLTDGRELLLDSARYLGITAKGAVLVVAKSQTLFLAPEQIKEARTVATSRT
jgi:hypothetical protein